LPGGGPVVVKSVASGVAAWLLCVGALSRDDCPVVAAGRGTV